MHEYISNDLNYDDFYAEGLAGRFFDYYESNGWQVGKNKMKDWKAGGRGWIARDNAPKKKKTTQTPQHENKW